MKFGSCATGVCEPCQVGNKAALNRISRVPQGCLAELTVKVTDMGFGSKRAARSLKKRTVFREKPGRIWASGGKGFLRAFFSYSSLVPFCVQIFVQARNLNAEGYEGSAIFSLLSKKSCQSAESIEDALLRMARGNSKVIYSGNGRLKNKIFQLRKKRAQK